MQKEITMTETERKELIEKIKATIPLLSKEEFDLFVEKVKSMTEATSN